MDIRKLMAGAAIALCLGLPTGATALEVKQSGKSVTETMDALVAAVEGAGAKVVARIDHASNAEGAGLELRPTQKLIFGNPALGSQAMLADQRAGLKLPMMVLVYEDEAGDVWVTYEAPADLFEGMEAIDPEAEFAMKMTGALDMLTAKAIE